MAKIAEILNECNIGDKLTNGTFNWTVTQRHMEDGELFVVASPDADNTDSFELWNCGTEVYAYMPGLKKI